MATNYRRGGRGSYHRGSSGAGSRWMGLRYAGTCKVCGAAIAAGARGYWDASAKTVTCDRLDCADADGLTRNEPLTGPWDKRTDTRVLADRRIGDAAPSVITTRFNSGAVVYQNARGRCEDAPCCGCCS
jgi:hypothetical protein